MTVYYYNDIGEIGVDVDFHSIQFCGGKCYFSANGEEYCIPVENLVEIVDFTQNAIEERFRKENEYDLFMGKD